jgi:uncharacterized protein YgbK (DUF1537 family)
MNLNKSTMSNQQSAISNHPSKTALFASLPPPWPEDLRPQIRAMVAAQPGHKLVVLDDDPTGTQTVHDVPVLTVWDVETLRAEFAQPGTCFYILTNSRSLPANAARELNREIARHLCEAVWRNEGFTIEPAHKRQLCCRAFTLVSRSDSTLRGHYPVETDVLAEELGPFDATILIPYFEAGGRCTVADVHYVAEGDALIPAAETQFARDAVFGYRQSNLRAWVEEKTSARIQAGQVASFSVAELRTLSRTHEPTRAVFVKLLALRHGVTAIVNACAPADMDFFAVATLWAEKAGGRYLFRTAAQFVAARLGLEPHPLWRPAGGTAAFQPPKTERPEGRPCGRNTGGLMVVGSHVPKTTEQLLRLLAAGTLEPIELSARDLLDGQGTTLTDAVQRVNHHITSGRDVALYTSRALVTGPDAAASLDIGARVSDALVEVVRQLSVRPRYLVAKGGITSSDLATRGLGVRRAMVLGQIMPGVPVWELGPETKFPGLPYVVFPGNVGGPEALENVIDKLKV